MKVALRTLINSQAALQELGREKFPAQLAYTILRNARKVEQVSKPELETIQQTGNALIEAKNAELGPEWTQNEKNKPILDQLNKDLDALLEAEVEVDVRTIALDQLTCDVKPGTLADLDWMIAFPDEAPEKPPRKKHK